MMNSINDLKKLSAIDINLLIVFQAIEDHRHITRAAKSLGLTQSAVSHSLGRLREVFKDSLFIKTSRGMVPTKKANEVASALPALLADLSDLFLNKEVFRPDKINRTFRIQTTDLIEHMLLPSILGLQQQSAMGLKVAFGNVGYALPQRLLEDGKVDLAVAGFFGKLPDGFFSQLLFDDSFRCCVSKSHPVVKRRLSLKQYCQFSHVLIAPSGELSGKVDKILKKQKVQRNVVVGTSGFLSAGWAVAQSDAILTAPGKLISGFEKYLPVKSMVPPIAIPDIKIVQVWHARQHNDPEHRWFREKMLASQAL